VALIACLGLLAAPGKAFAWEVPNGNPVAVNGTFPFPDPAAAGYGAGGVRLFSTASSGYNIPTDNWTRQLSPQTEWLRILSVQISPTGVSLQWGLTLSAMIDAAIPAQIVSGTISERGTVINEYTSHNRGVGYQYHGSIMNLPGKMGNGAATLTFTFVVENANNPSQGAWGRFECRL